MAHCRTIAQSRRYLVGFLRQEEGPGVGPGLLKQRVWETRKVQTKICRCLVCVVETPRTHISIQLSRTDSARSNALPHILQAHSLCAERGLREVNAEIRATFCRQR